MNDMKGILLDSGFDVSVNPIRDANGMIVSGFMIGKTVHQNAAIVLRCQQGDIKEDPLLGVGLLKFVRGKLDKSAINSRIRLHFIRAGIDYDGYKDSIKINTKTTE